MPNPISHDQNFKNLILDYSHQALEFFAASEAAHINPGAQITPIRQEQLKNRLGDRFHELDVPLLVEWPDGRRDALLFVLEEETSPQRFSIHRLAHYCLELSEMYGTSRVVPVVIFLRDARRLPTRLQLGGDQLTYLSFQYLKCDLAQLDASHYLDSQNLVARLNLPNMRWPEEQKVDIYAHAMSGLFSLEPDPEKQLKYIDFIDIYTALDDNQMHEYQQRYPQENSKMTGLTERLLQEGIQQGMQQGMQQGESALLLRQLQHKFITIPDTYRDKIEQADPNSLLKWGERVLDVNSLEDVFKD